MTAPWEAVAGLATCANPAELVERAANLVSDALRAHVVYLEIGPRRAAPIACRAVGLTGPETTTLRERLSRGIIAASLEAGKPVRTVSALDDARFAGRESVRRNSLEAVVCVPLPEPPAGVLWIQRPTSAGPFTDGELAVAQAVAAISAGVAARAPASAARASVAPDPAEDGVVAASRAMRDVLRQLGMVANLDVDVLLTGPTGAGKTELARWLSRSGSRAGKPFVDLNCAAIPETLFEAEMFGSRAGAHSTATRPQRGKVEEAHSGFLFLDEVSELAVPSQAKLLQLLQSRTYYPLGSSKAESADIRVVAATNRDLEQACAERRFRDDLYWRLAAFPISVPGLDARPDDIAPLAERFVAAATARMHLPAIALGASAVAWLEASEWPGHVRQLRNAVEQAVIRAASEGAPRIDVRHLRAQPSAEGRAFYALTERYQAGLLRRAHANAGGNAAVAAAELGLARSTFYKLWRELVDAEAKA